MTWSYTATAATAKDRIRDLIGDTDTTDQQIQDEQIAFYFAQEPSELLTAALICDMFAVKYARQVDKSVGSFSLSAGSKSTAYSNLATALRKTNVQNIANSAMPSAGGISHAEKAAQAANTDIVQPDFTRDMHNHPGASGAPSLTSF